MDLHEGERVELLLTVMGGRGRDRLAQTADGKEVGDWTCTSGVGENGRIRLPHTLMEKKVEGMDFHTR